MRQAAMDHWATVKRIHQSALDKDPSERSAFVIAVVTRRCCGKCSRYSCARRTRDRFSSGPQRISRPTCPPHHVSARWSEER